MKNNKNYTHEYNKRKARFMKHRRNGQNVFTLCYLLSYRNMIIYLFNSYNINGYYLKSNISVITSNGKNHSFNNSAIVIDRLLKKCTIDTVFYDFGGIRDNTPCISGQTSVKSVYTRIDQLTNVYNKNSGNFTFRLNTLSKWI